MVKLIDIPVFEGSLEKRIEKIVKLVDSSVKKVRWTNEEISEKFAKRSAEQILEEGHVIYMNPCLDYTLVLMEIFRRNSFDACMVAEEVDDTEYNPRGAPETQRVSICPKRVLHVAIEFCHEREVYFLDVSALNRVIFGKGPYVNTKKTAARVGILKIDSYVLDPTKPIYESMGYSSIEELGMLFKGFSFQHMIDRLIRDNTDRTWDAYKKKIAPDNGLYVVPANKPKV